MKIIEVYKVLEAGGYICEICPVQGQRTYKVMRCQEPQPAECVGTLTEKQFAILATREAITPSSTRTNKNGKIYNFYVTNKLET